MTAYLASLDKGIDTIRGRLSLPLGEKGHEGAPGGYRTRQEWHAKSRRLAVLQARRSGVAADRCAGKVGVVVGGRRLANTRHNLDAAGLTQEQWRDRWDAARMFLSADGETGKRYGNETICLTPDGQVTIKLPARLAHHANAPRGRYQLAAPVRFSYRGQEWAARVGAIAGGCVGVDTDDDHYAAWILDEDGNPIGRPKRFGYDMAGTCDHRDAQIRQAASQLLPRPWPPGPATDATAPPAPEGCWRASQRPGQTGRP